jgi:hypothetical protein
MKYKHALILTALSVMASSTLASTAAMARNDEGYSSPLPPASSQPEGSQSTGTQ